MQVWILTKGEDNQEEGVLGVYFSREAARPDFEREARQIDRAFSIDRAFADEDGTVHVHGGCDNLTLRPCTVKGAPPAAGRGVPALPASGQPALG